MNFTISDDNIKRVVDGLKLLQPDEMTDHEQNHVDADELLCSILPEEITREYEKIHKWYA